MEDEEETLHCEKLKSSSCSFMWTVLCKQKASTDFSLKLPVHFT